MRTPGISIPLDHSQSSIKMTPPPSMESSSADLIVTESSSNSGKGKTWPEAIRNQIVPTSGDINAMFSVFLDNLANLATMHAILVYNFGMPSDLVQRYFIPGPALGVMIGCLSLSLYAIFLDRKETNSSILYTSIPLGLDAPTTIGLPLLVIGPAFLKAKQSGRSDYDATMDAWLVGCSTVFIIGFFKLILTVFSFTLKYFHPVGKAGALAGIGLSLLGVNELMMILQEPVTGWVAMWLLFIFLLLRINKYNQIVNFELPFNISGVLVSALVGTIVYYVMAGAKISVAPLPKHVFSDYFLSFPHPANIFSTFKDAISSNLSIAIPYAILVNIGGLTISDAANLVGNKYNTRVVLLIDAVSTIISSFFGSTTQTTPYIGHTVFHHKFKARSGYSIITGLLIGFGGMLGYISFLSTILPKPAIVPIFIFITFEICSETFHPSVAGTIKRHHAPAIIWSFFPAIFQFVNIILSQVSPVLASSIVDPELVMKTLGIPPSVVNSCGVILLMAHGFICTSLFWGTALGFLLDNELKKSAIFLALSSVITFFGVIHSVEPAGQVYVPWQTGSTLPYQWAAGYLLVAIITFGFSFLKVKVEEQPMMEIESIQEVDLHSMENNNNNFANEEKVIESKVDESIDNTIQTPDGECKDTIKSE
ncbi:hypothetical protein SAMD00019534_011860 [Acytostelium subglobosum LB1]|uniref:hypothetical protein n=1 Tax=Acytostelium subglobosum LB1 TaxID=1410327 RepID=UPI00064487B3|nr:hypothetical protein SAMD00019534_011860 [Acytostelium subglobosum LB1]GAM18011.1 hypothetical protein SAMD00019534_011860 [Acytostelium subglobosum LB1]|eukprot:XP_012758607.1 hypothetical protein SAMD00019534_011860 [Acytostelium subglobosum LB1]